MYSCITPQPLTSIHISSRSRKNEARFCARTGSNDSRGSSVHCDLVGRHGLGEVGNPRSYALWGARSTDSGIDSGKHVLLIQRRSARVISEGNSSAAVQRHSITLREASFPVIHAWVGCRG